VQLVDSRDVKNLPGRPKTDKLDSVWLAKLTEKGLLRASFVPPAPLRELCDYARLRVGLTRERTRHWLRLEKLLEDSLIKLSSVASRALIGLGIGPAPSLNALAYIKHAACEEWQKRRSRHFLAAGLLCR